MPSVHILKICTAVIPLSLISVSIATQLPVRIHMGKSFFPFVRNVSVQKTLSNEETRIDSTQAEYSQRVQQAMVAKLLSWCPVGEADWAVVYGGTLPWDPR
jgi:hypothetical protein